MVDKIVQNNSKIYKINVQISDHILDSMSMINIKEIRLINFKSTLCIRMGHYISTMETHIAITEHLALNNKAAKDCHSITLVIISSIVTDIDRQLCHFNIIIVIVLVIIVINIIFS